MTTDYEKFEAEMKERDTKLPSDGPITSIGMKDEKGSLLILGGHKANLWQLKSYLYAVAGEVTAAADKAIELYNEYNGTKLPSDYIWMQFEPWYQSQYKLVANVPSKSDPNRTYAVRRNPSGELTCECLGFTFRGYCWHTEAVKELSNGS